MFCDWSFVLVRAMNRTCYYASSRGVCHTKIPLLVILRMFHIMFLINTWCERWAILNMLDNKVCRGIVILHI